MNMMTTDAWTGDEDSATSKLVAAWEQKLTKNTAKAAGLGLMAVSLAACGDSDSNDAPVTPVTPVTPTPTTVNGADNDGEAVDGGGTATVELKGNTDPNVDAGEWINVANLLVRDANGDFTITDLQASENDASDGSAGMDIALDDIGQNTAGTTTLNFDTQAIDEADTVVNLSLDEVAGTVALTGNSAIETVNITIADGVNEASDLAGLSINGVTTLNITGGVDDQLFRIDSALDTTITTIDASGVIGDTVLVVTGGAGGTYSLGSGTDFLVMGDSLDSNDVIDGGADAFDEVNINLQTATIRMPTMTNVEFLGAVFDAAATVDGSNISGLTTIGLGVDPFGNYVDSSADADFNDMKAEVTDLVVLASQQDIEMDYESGAEADLTISFRHTAAETIGDDANASDMHLINVKDLTINHESANSMLINNSIDLSNDTETLTITTSMEGGDLFINDNNGSFVNTNELTDVLISAVDGDMDLSFNGGSFNFIEDVQNLQTYEVNADDADLLIGEIGNDEAAVELETLILNMVDESSLEHGDIDAYQNNVGANISLFEVTASDKNITANGNNESVYLYGLSAEQVDNMVLNANDGGDILLEQQEYTVTTQTYTGTGDIQIDGGNGGPGGFVQTQAADASGHSGDREYDMTNGNDTLYGSSGADDIDFFNGGTDAYFDAGGNDDITFTSNGTVTSIFDDGTSSLTDTGVATDDTYSFFSTTATMTVGGGADTLNLNSGTVLVDFADYDSGIVTINSFTTGTDTLSFNGLGQITAVSGIAAPAAVGNMNVNAVYVFADGDAVSAGTATIADYTNMTDVADYLDQDFTQNQTAGDEAVFIINNGTTTANTGDTEDAYIYYYEETGVAGVQAADLTLIGTADGATIVAADVV